MAALSNIDGALCSTPQSLADAHYQSGVQQRCQDAKADELCWGAQTPEPISAASGPKFAILGDMWRTYCSLTSFSDCRYMP